MASAGDRIENPVTGERLSFIRTAADTAGELLAIEVQMSAGGRIAATHVHTRQEERFAVRSGTIRLRVGGKERSAGVGEEVVVAAGVPHSWWNETTADATVRVEFRPALDTETFFETFFGLARDGRTNRKGMPKLLQSLVLVADLGDSCPTLPSPPHQLQRAVARALAPFGRLIGYRAVYPRHSPNHPGLSG